MRKIVSTFFYIIIPLLSFSQGYRYTERLFSGVTITSDVTYATMPQINPLYLNESFTTNIDLKMDIHQPTGDVLSERPAIIFVHSGGFLLGSKANEDMVAYCDSFASRGYVTATIQYRLGMNVLSAYSSTRGVYRGIQDGKSAVRYLRANAALYNIDPNRVYMVGSSAGALVALHDVFLNDLAEIPIETDSYTYTTVTTTFPFINSITAPDLGDYDIGDYLGENSTPDAVISLWGSLQDTNLITTETTPTFLMHGTIDGTVPFGTGSPFGLATLPATYGSEDIDLRFKNLGNTNFETYFVEGADHEFHGTSNGDWSNGVGGNAYWDTIVNKSRDFLYQQHKPTANFDITKNLLETTFTNASSVDALTHYWDFGDGNTSIMANPVHTYATDGTYNVKLHVENEILSWDTISVNVLVSSTSLEFEEDKQIVKDRNLKNQSEKVVVGMYNIHGQLVDKYHKGFTILMYEDGTKGKKFIF